MRTRTQYDDEDDDDEEEDGGGDNESAAASALHPHGTRCPRIKVRSDADSLQGRDSLPALHNTNKKQTNRSRLFQSTRCDY